MNYEKQADLLLYALGKEMAASTAEYMDSLQEKRKKVPLRKRPMFLKMQRGIVAIFIVGVLVTGFSAEVRAAVFQAFHYVFDTFAEYVRISPEEPSKVPTGWQPSYELGWIPDNYYFVLEDSETNGVNTAYCSDKTSESFINFWQTESSSYSISIDNETTIHEVTHVQGCKAHLYYELWEGEPDTPEGICGNIILIWQKGDTAFELNCTFLSRADILKIAENVVPIND